MSVEQLIFDGFAIVAIASAVMVVILPNPVHSALSLVLAFFENTASNALKLPVSKAPTNRVTTS